MTAPQIENIDSPLNKQHQQIFLWNNSSSVHTIASQEIDIFTKEWTRRNKNTPMGTYPSVSTASLPVSSPIWLQRDNYIHTENLGITPIVSATALLSLNEKDYQGKRNILLTNVPMANYLAINAFINCFSDIKDILKKPTFDDVTMVIVFYDTQQALQCYSSLSQLLQQQPDLCEVGLTFINSPMVASSFDIPLNDLQDTHLLVSLYGPFSQLAEFDYMKMLETIESVRYFKELEFTESQRSLVVEYSDTRTAVATHKLLHGKIYKGIIFKARLFKPDDEPGRSLPITQSTNVLQPILENDDSCEYPGGIHHYSRLVSGQGYLENKNRTMNKRACSHWTLELPPKLSSHSLRPSISTSSSLSSSSSESSLTPPPSSTPSPIHSTFTGNSFLRHGSSSTATTSGSAKHHHHHHHHHKQKQQRQQEQHDNQLVEVPQRLSVHLLGPLIREFSSTSLDSTANMTARRSDHPHAENDFDVKRVIQGLDRRTTFMIRNIPNKYDQAMLMEWIDVTHKGTYDFLYLRIDFKNKCNVGYAFINFIKVESVISFAKQRIGKQWNRFNSQKICELAYANIQGKANLIKKFQNSCVMDQEEAFQPKIFYSSGIHQGKEESFPAPTNSDNKRG